MDEFEIRLQATANGKQYALRINKVGNTLEIHDELNRDPQTVYRTEEVDDWGKAMIWRTSQIINEYLYENL